MPEDHSGTARRQARSDDSAGIDAGNAVLAADGEHRRLERREGTQFERQRKHVSANGNRGQDPVDQVGRRIGHSTACTAWANRPILAREGDEQVVNSLHDG